MKKVLVLISFCLMMTLLNLSAHAVSLSGGNLGYTSFMDGFGTPGLFSDQYLYYYNADEATDNAGHERPGKNKMHNLMWLTSFKYITDKVKIIGGMPGVEFTLPVIIDLHVENQRFTENEHNVGDLFTGVFLQSPKLMLFDKYPFWHRFEFMVKWPTGHYDSNDYINAGNNSFAINPYYAFTIMPTPKLEFSARLFYKWTAKNDDPTPTISPKWDPKSGTPPEYADNTQEGQAVWANYATSYEITKNFRLGVNGYYLQQLTDHKADGKKIQGSKEKVLAIGPGVMFISNNKKELLFYNFYNEVYSENRSKGFSMVLRWLHVF
jgi:hypothetical protein